ncbi:hypothetical protein NDU88_006967, partial [Pleurodeles waltl]
TSDRSQPPCPCVSYTLPSQHPLEGPISLSPNFVIRRYPFIFPVMISPR